MNNENRPLPVISSFEFVTKINNGQVHFKNTHITGKVDFGELTVDKLFLENVSFESSISGLITIRCLKVHSPNCLFWSNISSTYSGSVLKDFTSK